MKYHIKHIYCFFYIKVNDLFFLLLCKHSNFKRSFNHFICYVYELPIKISFFKAKIVANLIFLIFVGQSKTLIREIL